MSDLDISVKIKNYKCFRDEFAGFDKIKPVNIIIGRNNSGKSSLLDILQFVISEKVKTKGGVLQIEDTISEGELKSVFGERYDGGLLSGNNHWGYHGCKLSGLKVSYEIGGNSQPKHKWLNPELFKVELSRSSDLDGRKKMMDEFMGKATTRIPDFFKNKIVVKLSSERDIRPEGKGKSFHLEGTGAGATNTICRYTLNSNLDRDVIKKKMLTALNQIFSPDSQFDEITVKHHEEYDTWEIYLEEKEKGLIPLSLSGSGLKTVILVLLNLLVVPEQKNGTGIENYIFAFEELENNAHPALLRRLLKFIEDFAVKNNCYFFITTHSNVVIDLFSYSKYAQIIHVNHNGCQAFSTTVDSFTGHNAVLDDLGVKASDILQSNGVVWLEGPSDRIYFNKWIELYSAGELREHKDYECAFYGGALLKHFEAAEPNESNDTINILRVNRNAILIGDSDKTGVEKKIKARLKRIKEEMEKIKAHVWVTGAKEVENYIPATVLEKVFKKTNLPEIGQYQRFYCESDTSNLKTEDTSEKVYWRDNELKGRFDKVELAHKVVDHLTKEMLDSRFDLKKQMEEICKTIKKWNDTKPHSKKQIDELGE